MKTITDWPVIVQGALGSALFWIVLELGQRSLSKLTSRLGSELKTASWFALAAHEDMGSLSITARFFCIYGAAHYALKGLIVTVLALGFSPFMDIFALAGYLLGAYFFFRALAFVPHSKSLGTSEKRKKSLEAITQQIGKNANGKNI